MAEPRRKQRARQAVPLRLNRLPVRRQPLRIVQRPITSSPKAVAGHRVTNIVQFKSKSTGRYLVAVYTQNPRTKKEERVIVNPKTLSTEKLNQLKAWHAHHKSKGSWVHAIATDPHTWATIGKILLAG